MNRDTLHHSISFIQSWLADRYEEGTIPGFVVAISHQGEVVMNEAYGYADLERGIPMTTDHVFRIASHSKTFTATAMMLLAEAGRLRIDDHVADFLPWLADHEDERWRRVTLRQLLSHGAGVIRDGLDTDYWAIERAFPDAARFIREIKETGLVLDNNVKMKYTNYGYTLLGLVIEAVAGQPYNEFVQERIVQPLGLSHTFPEYRPQLNQPKESELVTGYTRPEPKRRLPIAAVNTHAMSPATGFCSTSSDLCAYFTAQMVGSGKLLSDESKKEMQRAAWPMVTPGQPRNREYGLGFILRRYDDRHTFGHSGGFPGCITNTMADAKDGIVVTALTNSVDGPAEAIVSGIYQILNRFARYGQTEHPERPERSGGPERSAPVEYSGESRHPERSEWSVYEGAYANLEGSFYIVAAGDHLETVGGGWDPLAMGAKLEWVEGETFKIVETGSGGSEGELVHFRRDGGRVVNLVFAGSTAWPKDAWRQRLAGKDRISL